MALILSLLTDLDPKGHMNFMAKKCVLWTIHCKRPLCSQTGSFVAFLCKPFDPNVGS